MTAARKLLLAGSLAAGSVIAVAVGLPGTSAPRQPAPTTAVAATAAPGCWFEPGETAAFELESTVRDVRGADEDRFQGILSWQVVERPTPSTWRLRAALSDVARTDELTLPEERASGPLTDPFFVDVDSSCRFVGFGFARDWDTRRRQLVQSLLRTHEFVLPSTPGKRGWSASQSDGMGSFAASYVVASGGRGPAVRVQRHKDAYDGQAGAAALGLSVAVVGSDATASFDRERPRWLTRSAGVERVQIHVQGELAADLLQRFSLTRDDGRFVAMRAVDPKDADFREASDLAVEGDRLAGVQAAQVPYDAALAAFLAQFDGPGDASYAAARQLAAWLRAHPDAAPRLVTALRADAIADAARPALFLALELAGSEPARTALADVLVDPRLRALDRARAASALSDIGGPTRGTAELLLTQAQGEREEMVANVSLLGLGHLARRSGDDELRTYVRDSLGQELAAAGTDEGRTHVLLDAMGNTGDPAFADALGTHLTAESAVTRQHAAEALGRLDPAEAGPRLLDRLAEETDPAVGAAMVGAYHGPATGDAIALMSDRLATSSSVSERAALIAWLGAASRTEPEARSRLLAHAGQETNARLMQQVGSFVPAEALR